MSTSGNGAIYAGVIAVVLATGCSTPPHRVSCERPLQPINAPARQAQEVAKPPHSAPLPAGKDAP
jgi:hypothetical protein